MQLRLYNTLSKREEPFEPLDPAGKIVTFYTCGPTVYDYAHIGNFRSFLNADVLRRTLELLGCDVRQVMNMTDVGHMTDDDVADGSGEDKMEVAAKRLAEAKKAGTLPPGTEVDPNDPYAIANFYADAFLEDGRALGLEVVRDAQHDPAVMPRPTQYVRQMIELVRTLLEKGHAYIASDGVVYFDVQSYADYGRLSGNTPEQIRSGRGGRVSAQTQAVKKHPADFMLWKPDPRHLMRWPSPWGEGYPGWHLECSVMALDLLAGDRGMVDIHSGGEDNIFPHHECEIAQSRCATGRERFARFWFHTRFLIVEGEKMSKSKGNFFTVRDLVAKGASPAAIRLELIKTHYRSNANFTMQGLKDAQRQIDRWKRLEQWLEAQAGPDARGDAPDQPVGDGPLGTALHAFTAALCSDLNVAGAIGALNEAAAQYSLDEPSGNGSPRAYDMERTALRRMNAVLGVLDLETEGRADTGDLDVQQIESMIEARNAARNARNFAEADRLRDELLAMGIEIKDSAQGTTWQRAVQ